MAAQVLHDAFKRHGGPFFAMNCAAIPAEMLKSELFGHMKAAFTGAECDHFVESATMPLAIGAKLGRAIQERVVMPLGSDRPVGINVASAARPAPHLADDATSAPSECR